jgi:hypothetical protein
MNLSLIRNQHWSKLFIFKSLSIRVALKFNYNWVYNFVFKKIKQSLQGKEISLSKFESKNAFLTSNVTAVLQIRGYSTNEQDTI